MSLEIQRVVEFYKNIFEEVNRVNMFEKIIQSVSPNLINEENTSLSPKPKWRQIPNIFLKYKWINVKNDGKIFHIVKIKTYL